MFVFPKEDRKGLDLDCLFLDIKVGSWQKDGFGVVYNWTGNFVNLVG